MKRKTLKPIAFPMGDGEFSSMSIGVRVHESGLIELTGLIRMPYSNRPKEGGGIAIPYRALNAKSNDKAQGLRFERVRVGVLRHFNQGKPYISPYLTGIQPQKGERRTRNNA